MKHGCAVCWAEQAAHEIWFQHATEEHGAILQPFDYDVCEHDRSCPHNCRAHIATCPGLQHGKRQPNYDQAVQRRRPEPQPFTARDGTSAVAGIAAGRGMSAHRPKPEPRRCECRRWKRLTPFHCILCMRWKPAALPVCERCAAERREAA